MGVIRFPNLGFEVTVGKSVSLFGFSIAFYGVIIAVGMVLGVSLAYYEARRTGQKVDHYIDYTIFGIIGAIIGARLYYVAFEWKSITAGATGFWQTLGAVFNIRGGGLAIYGGIIGAVLVMIVYTRIKKLNIFRFMDTMVLALLVGQIIGRWGNFFNREAFGCFTFDFLGAKTDLSEVGLFKLIAMQIPIADVAYGTYTPTMVVNSFGHDYVQVLPTFLLESIGNVVLLALIMVFRDKKKFYGETTCRYLFGYGLLRFFLEGFRTDQLKIGNVAVSQIVSLVLVVASVVIIVLMRLKLKGKPSMVAPIPTKEERKAMEEAEKAEEAAKKAAKKAAKEAKIEEDVELNAEEATQQVEEVETVENQLTDSEE